MKRVFGAILAFVLIGCLLTGCGAKKQALLTAENEIATYTKVDPKRTQLIVSRLGNNANIEGLAAAFEQKNPDVQVICVDLTGGTNAYRPVVDYVTHSTAPDVMFVNADTFVDDELIVRYLEDLSVNSVIERFEAEALNRVAVNGFVYFLPAPSEVNCIIYNKTMFEQYGWQVPENFDEFIALCLQIREDTNGEIQPWNPNAKYDNVFTTAFEAFTYSELFAGKENRTWYMDFCAGKATFTGHMEPFYNAITKLIENGILTEAHFNYSATTRGKDFQEGLLAMYNAPISKMSSKEYTFDFMPYPSTDGSLGYVNDAFSSMMCVPKKEHTDAEKDALNRFIIYFASVEGQQALIGESMMVSNVKGVPLNEFEAMDGISNVIAQGHTFSRLDFPGSGERNWTFRDNALAMVTQQKTADEIISEIDAHPYKSADESGNLSALKIADVAEEFTILEFSCYIADMYREKAGADIGLINHGIAYRGNLVRIFAGEIYDSYMNPIKPRSFANGSTLVRVSMTGRQLMNALNHPLGNTAVSDSVYAFSGLQCEVAPWNELGTKYLSVKLADGSALDMDKLYTVAIWAGTVADEYITETLESYEGTWEELMAEKLKADGTIAPAKDGRIKLIWK